VGEQENAMVRFALAFLAVAALVMIDTGHAVAETYRPWCADYGGSTNCGFSSWEQCRMTASGTNTFCVQNQWYLDEQRHKGRTRR
jgi:Protein of unknown function (DUF3551)